MIIKRRLLLTFFVLFALFVGNAFYLMNTRYFNNIVKGTLHGFLKKETDLTWDFSKVKMQLWYPGIIIKGPKIKYKDINIQGEELIIEFKPVQLFTKKININAIKLIKGNVSGKFEISKSSNKKTDFNLDYLIKTIFNVEKFGSLNLKLYGIHLFDSSIGLSFNNDLYRFASSNTSLSLQRSSDGIRVFLDASNLGLKYDKIIHDLTFVNVSTELTPKEINVGSLKIQKGKLSLAVFGNMAGKISDINKAKLNFSYFIKGDLNELNSIIKKRITGDSRIDGIVKGTTANPEITSKINFENASILENAFKTLKSDVVYKNDVLNIKNISVKYVDEGTVSLSDINIPKEFLEKKNVRKEISAKIVTQKADLHQILGSELSKKIFPLHALLSGNINLNFVGSQEAWKVISKGNLEVNNLILDNQNPKIKKPRSIILSVPKFYIDLNSELVKDKINFDGTKIKILKTVIEASGDYQFKDYFNLNFNSKNIVLSEIGKLADSQLKGEGGLECKVRGGSDNVWVNFDLKDVKDAEYLNLKLGKITGNIAYEDARTIVHIDNAVGYKSAPQPYYLNGEIGVGDNEFIKLDISLKDYQANDLLNIFSKITEDIWWMPNSLTGVVNGQAKISGMPSLDKLIILAKIDANKLEYLGEKFKEAKLLGGYKQGTYYIDDGSIKKRNGTFDGSISLDPNLMINYKLKSSKLSLREFDFLTRWGIPLEGVTTISSIGQGKLGHIYSDSEINFDKISLAHRLIKPSKFRFMGTGDALRGDVSLFEKELIAKLKYVYSSDVLSELKIDLNEFSLGPLLGLFNSEGFSNGSFGGNINGKIDLTFLSNRYRNISGNVSIDKVKVYKDLFKLENENKINVNIDEGALKLDPIKFTSSLSKIILSGSSKRELSNLNFSLKGNGDYRYLEFLTPAIEAATGIVNIDGKLVGDIENPELIADLDFQNGEIKIKNLEQKIESIKGKSKLKNGVLHFDNFTGILGGGDVKASGTLEFYKEKFPELHLMSNLVGCKVKIYPFQFLSLNGSLFVDGVKYPYDVTGKIDLESGLIKQNFDSKTSGTNSNFIKGGRYLPQRQDESADIFALDIDAKANGNVFVSNDLMDAEFKGDVKLVNTITLPRVLGKVESIQGKLLFKDYDFAINSCVVKFNSRTEFNPEFNLNAQTELSNYKVILFASGDLSKMKVDLSSNPQLPQSDLVSLLTLGSTGGDLKKIKGEDQLSYSSAEVGSLIIDQLKINKDIQKRTGFRISLDQSITTSNRNIFGQRFDSGDRAAPKVVVRRRISDKIDALVASTVGIGENQRQEFNLELHVNKNISLLGAYENTSNSSLQENNQTSLGADLRLKWGFK